MKKGQTEIESENQASTWLSTQHANIIRYVPSGGYYARFRVHGKLIWKSLKTKAITVAQMRLADMEKEERKKAASGHIETKDKVLFQHAITAYRENGFRPVKAKTKKDARKLKPASIQYYEERISHLLRSWPELEQMEVRKITERDCKDWADRFRKGISPTVFNHTLGVLRNLIDFGIKAGCRYDNPAKEIMRESESSKTLELPTADQFTSFVKEIEHSGSGKSKPCAELVQFFAFSGFRKGEAAYVTWADCDFERGQIIARGHPETGLKNRTAGETRPVPMIPDMRQLLERMSQSTSASTGNLMQA